MAVAPQPPAAHDDLPRRKNKGRHLPLTPPNVSVEAIKRSLLHTPSPRRFKKLRLRRLQENKKRDQVTQQLPLVDAGLGSLERACRGDRDDDGSCAIDLPFGEHDELGQLDLAILNIGLDDDDDDDVELDNPVKRDQLLPRRMGCTCETPQQDPLDKYQGLRDQDKSISQAPDDLGKKKKARNTKTKRNQSRRLPVDELVLTAERVAELAPPEDSDNAGELSKDPISQMSSEDGCPKCRRHKSRRRSKNSVRRGFRDIDISEFRLPKSRNSSLKVRSKSAQAADYADGFEDEERIPIGKQIPISQRVRRSSRFSSANARREELQLVAHKDFGDQDDNTPIVGGRTCHQFVERTALSDADELNQQNARLVDPFLDENYAASLFEQDPELPDTSSIISDIQTTRTISSPLARKQSQIRKVRFDTVGSEREESSSMLSLPRKDVKESVVDGVETEQDKSELQCLTPFSSRTGHNPDEGLSALQEFARVSVRKRADSSDSDDGSVAEPCPCPYRPVEEQFKEFERLFNTLRDLDSEYEEDLLDLDSGDEGDIEMAYDVHSHLIQPESGQRDRDEIDDESGGPSSYISKDVESYAGENRGRKMLPEAKDFWRSQKSKPTGVAMEVDDDIIYSPKISRATSRTSSDGGHYARRLSSIASQALILTGTSTDGMGDDQGSIELGDNQRLQCTPEIPETQLEQSQAEEERDAVQYMVFPEDNYFTRASQNLDELS